MAMVQTTLSEEYLPAFYAFVAQTWPEQPVLPSWLDWRYNQPPGQEFRIAVRDGEVIACLGVRRRQWVVGDVIQQTGETFAWFCRPDLRMTGLGVRLFKRAMHDFTPMIAVGGSDDTRTLLPRLGWQQVGDAPTFVLPLRGAAVAERIHDKTHVPKRMAELAFDAVGRHLLRRPSATVPGGEVVPVAHLGEDVAALYQPRAGLSLCAIPDAAQSRWLSGHAGNGTHIALNFVVHGELVGCGQARVYAQDGARYAVITELWSTLKQAPVYQWMVGAMVRAVRGFDPVSVRMRATSPVLQQALGHHRFIVADRPPLWVWAGRKGTVPSGTPHIVFDLEDHHLLPMMARS